ncbi:MAG TPA: hypothetical protein VMX17_01530 [Candidatus Glassbacteria bacterium]|nr:hypothetical protein [Candidatus Glassbacteria bacterium]
MSDLNEEKISEAHSEILNILQNKKLNVKELVLLYGNLGYTIGASIGGYQDKGPSEEEVLKMYMEKPSIDVALMAQGINITTWIDDLGNSIEKVKGEIKKNEANTT